jgi:hypothetical protein
MSKAYEVTYTWVGTLEVEAENEEGAGESRGTTRVVLF